MAFQRKVAVTWADVAKGDRVILAGEHRAWTVTKAKRGGKKVAVVVERDGKTFGAKMPAKAQVERFEKIKGKGKAWTEPETKGEEVVAEVLGAKLEAIRPASGEVWVVPPVDQSTVAAHLFLYHGIDPAGRELGDIEGMLETHAGDHERPIDDLHVPHRHSKRRPVVDIGPKFQ